MHSENVVCLLLTAAAGHWGHATQSLTVCGRGRDTILHQSTGHQLNIHLDRSSVLDELSPFVIKYEGESTETRDIIL